MVTMVSRWWVTGLGGPQLGARAEVAKPRLTSGEEPTRLTGGKSYPNLYCDSHRAYLCNLGVSFSDFWKNGAKI